MPFRNKQEKQEQREKEKKEQQLAEEQANNILIVNTDFISNRNLQTIELVSGSHFVFAACGENEINVAINNMKRRAAKLEADAIINFRVIFTANCPYVWGTAVKFI